MTLIRDLSELKPVQCGGAVTIGNFDGVHRGHAALVEQLIASARRVGGQSVVFTFDPHPVRLLRPEQAPPPLTWTDRKAELLFRLGVDVVLAYPTDRQLLQLTPHEFFERIVIETLRARAIVEGPNFHFGCRREGNVSLLAELCEAHGVALQIVPPLLETGQYVSSSRVRADLARGDVAEARRLLVQPYRIRGMVTHGARRGAALGFPTANLQAIDTLLPAPGVYAGRGLVEGQWYAAAINIGPNPTFGEAALKVEAHLLDYHGSLYGQPLEVDFLERLRDIRTFASAAQLKQQLQRDLQQARDIFTEFSTRNDPLSTDSSMD